MCTLLSRLSTMIRMSMPLQYYRSHSLQSFTQCHGFRRFSSTRGGGQLMISVWNGGIGSSNLVSECHLDLLQNCWKIIPLHPQETCFCCFCLLSWQERNFCICRGIQRSPSVVCSQIRFEIRIKASQCRNVKDSGISHCLTCFVQNGAFLFVFSVHRLFFSVVLFDCA